MTYTIFWFFCVAFGVVFGAVSGAMLAILAFTVVADAAQSMFNRIRRRL